MKRGHQRQLLKELQRLQGGGGGPAPMSTASTPMVPAFSPASSVASHLQPSMSDAPAVAQSLLHSAATALPTAVAATALPISEGAPAAGAGAPGALEGVQDKQ